ncbi:MAG: spore photoproduct lyase family protein [Armatimonadota bacterium]
MYKLEPLKVFALDRVQDDPRCLARMERMLSAIDRGLGDVVEINEANLPEVVAELQGLWPPEQKPESVPLSYLRPLVFTVQELSGQYPDITPILKRCPENTAGYVHQILGHIDPVRPFHQRENDWRVNWVCWPTHDFGTMNGCPHGCQYCGDGKFGKFIAIGVNLEDFMEQAVGPTVHEYSWQRCFRMIGWDADHIAFEPEYGCIDLFTTKLAQYEGRYGYFHSTSSNVDWIADLQHRDRLIGVWSTTCEAVARDLEQGAGSALDRIEAARKCQAMGVPVRFKFKPTIPVRNWREEYAAIIEQMFRLTQPESVGFCVIMWMTLDTLASKIDLDLLDQAYVQAARDTAEEMKDSACGPFPPHVRREIYSFLIQQVRRWDKEVPLYISTETREMWDDLKDELGQDPRAYRCGCSSVVLPGRRIALSRGCPGTTYLPPR